MKILKNNRSSLPLIEDAYDRETSAMSGKSNYNVSKSHAKLPLKSLEIQINDMSDLEMVLHNFDEKYMHKFIRLEQSIPSTQ